jgi:hypothetical protein
MPGFIHGFQQVIAMQPNADIADCGDATLHTELPRPGLGALLGLRARGSLRCRDLAERAVEFLGRSVGFQFLGHLYEALVLGRIVGSVVGLCHAQFASEYRDTPFPKGVPKFSQYGVCLYLLTDALANFVRMKPSKNRLKIGQRLIVAAIRLSARRSSVL